MCDVSINGSHTDFRSNLSILESLGHTSDLSCRGIRSVVPRQWSQDVGNTIHVNGIYALKRISTAEKCIRGILYMVWCRWKMSWSSRRSTENISYTISDFHGGCLKYILSFLLGINASCLRGCWASSAALALLITIATTEKLFGILLHKWLKTPKLFTHLFFKSSNFLYCVKVKVLLLFLALCKCVLEIYSGLGFLPSVTLSGFWVIALKQYQDSKWANEHSSHHRILVSPSLVCTPCSSLISYA